VTTTQPINYNAFVCLVLLLLLLLQVWLHASACCVLDLLAGGAIDSKGLPHLPQASKQQLPAVRQQQQ
jgi:hypothetical protein